MPYLLVNTITGWDEPPRARHQFAHAMAKTTEVIFVARNKTGWPRLSISQPEEKITLVEPSFPLDYRLRYRMPIINEFYQIWLYRQLRRKYASPVAVVNFDFTATKLHLFYENPIYYCNDEYTSTSKYNFRLINTYISRCERLVAQKSKFCIATSHYLVSKLSAYNPHTYEIPLGVPVLGFEPSIKKMVKEKRKIVAGIVGYISLRQVPVEVINNIIDHDAFQLVIIGPVEDSFLRKINQPDKVIMTGVLKGKELFDRIGTLDVGLALYNMKTVNKGTTPNKLWQYLLLGKPVVVSNLPNLKHMSFPDQSIYTLINEEDAAITIMRTFDENSEKLEMSRTEFAKQNTWSHRVQKFIQILQTHFPGICIENPVGNQDGYL